MDIKKTMFSEASGGGVEALPPGPPTRALPLTRWWPPFRHLLFGNSLLLQNLLKALSRRFEAGVPEKNFPNRTMHG